MKKIRTSIATNLANFRLMLDFIEQNQANYNPASPELSFENLSKAYNLANQAINQVSNAQAIYQQAVSDRKKEFNKLSPTSTLVINSLRCLSVCPQTISNLQQTARRIKGYALSPVTDNTQRRTYQLDFNSRLQNFNHYITQLENIEQYKTNSPELTTQNLRNLAETLQARTNNVNQTLLDLKKNQEHRNQTFNNQTEGILTLAARVNAYLSTIYQTANAPYRLIYSLKFSNPNN